MKKVLITLITLTFIISSVKAQTTKYTTFVYTSTTLSDDIKSSYENLQRGERGWGEDLGVAALNAAKGIASGYVTSIFDLGVQAVASLITREQRLRQEWEQTVDAENHFETRIASVKDMSDFYTSTSTDGALDPKNMTFDGIGCLRMEGTDTMFYISCHIDRSKIDRIVRHSKFQLVVDTLIISPYHSNLPNSTFDTVFSFNDRDNYILTMQIEVTSSWMDQLPQMHKDQPLGEFTITIPVKKNGLDSNGFLRFVRIEGEESKYPVIGESFIVPRTYTGIRDHNSGKMIYGTGEYNLSINIKENCSITEEYDKNWKQNRRKRAKAAKEGQSLLASTWQTITSQQWDEIGQQWIITVLQAPVDIIKENAIERLSLSPTE